MAIQTYVEVTAEDVVRGMIDDPGFGMDVLAGLAQRADECAFHEGDCGSTFHSRVPAWLEATANALRINAE